MAGPEWGEAHIEVTADGSTLDRSIARMAEQAGRVAGARLAASFAKATDGMTGDLEKQFNRLGNEMNKTERIVSRLDRSFLKLWKTLPHGFRQFTFYTGLFAALGSSIAVLGSVAGAGLTTLGAAASAVGIGLTAAVIAFTGLGGALEDLPPAIQPAVAALRRVGDAFVDMRNAVQIAVLENAAGAFESLEKTVRSLIPAMTLVGKSVAKVIDSLAKNIAPGTKAFTALNTVVERAGPIFERVATIVGKFGRGLLTAFASPAMDRAVNDLLDWLEELADGFERFTESRGLEEWLSRSTQIFGAVGGLLAATGKLLDDLVTPEATNNLNRFIDNLAEFMPTLTLILDGIGRLDVFGLVAQALNDIGDAIEPILGPLGDLFDEVNRIVGIAIDEWAADLKPLFDGLAPVIQAVADALGDIKTDDVRAIADALAIFAGALVVMWGAGKLAAVAGALGGIASAFKTLEKIDTKKLGKGLVVGLLAGILTAFVTEGGSDFESKLQSQLTATLGGALVGWSVGGPVGALIGAAVATIVAAIQTNWDVLTSQIDWNPFNGSENSVDWGEFGAQFAEGLPAFFENLAPAWTGGWESSIFNIAVTGMSQFFVDLVAGFISGFAAVQAQLAVDLATIGAGFITFFTSVGEGWNFFWTNLPAIVTVAWTAITTAVSTAWTTVVSFFATFIGQLVGMWNGFWGGLGAVVTVLWTAVTTAVSSGWNTVSSTFSSFIGSVTGAWNSFWGGLGGIVGGIWAGIVSTVSGAVATIKGIINGMITAINSAISAVGNLSGGLISLPALPKLASGGIAFGPSIAGEDGPELVIPLQRNLSRVNPLVRPLSAMLQGKAGTQTEVNNNSPSRSTIFGPGSVVVNTKVTDPRLVGSIIFDAVVAKMA